MIKLNCKQCDKEFSTYPSKIKVGKGKFCSKECYGVNETGRKLSSEHKAKIKNFMLTNPTFLGKKHNDSSIEKMRLANKGKRFSLKTEFKKGLTPWNKGMLSPALSERNRINNPSKKGKDNANWKGGVTPVNAKIRNSLEMKLFRKACMERDNFTCQKTGQIGGELVVHHINNFADFPELRTSISNGVTLSKESHKEFHNIYGKKNNTREQLVEFLQSSAQEA